MRECSRMAEETLRQRLGELTPERRSRARETAADERPPQADGGPPSPPFLAATSEAVGGEAVLLAAPGQAIRGFEFLVPFNGKSYDVPFLLGRALVNRVELRLPPRHLDLLHAARRRWRRELPDCRLQTLELHVRRRRRAGDVPG